MLTKCANPACNTPFHYLREGKLFRFDSAAVAGPALVTGKKPMRRVEHFWLCGPCSAELTVTYDREHGVITAPLRPQARAAAS
jgi:hypothetical protein